MVKTRMPNTPDTTDLNDLIPDHVTFPEMPTYIPPPALDTINRSPVFDVRYLGWEHISTIVENNVIRAIEMAHIDWLVLPRLVIVDGMPVPGRFANVRSDLPPGSNVIEIVGSKYQIIQNKEGLAFVQNIIDSGLVTIERAGMYDEGRSVFLLAKAPDITIDGEVITPYVTFCNSHDGSGKVKAAITTVRAASNSALPVSLMSSSTPRMWAITHTKSAVDHMAAASESMHFIGNYLAEYPRVVGEMMHTRVTIPQVDKITAALFPIPQATEHNKTAVTNAKDARYLFERVYGETPDLRRWEGTVWGLLCAYADVISHREPRRATATFDQNRFANNMIAGRDMERAQSIIMAIVRGA
jgi:phage/plasmid-like protein (TIGR03299 family)